MGKITWPSAFMIGAELEHVIGVPREQKSTGET